MKIIEQKSEVARTNIGQEVQFSIEATAQSFNILSSSLYSNKILAIIRELSCNALDSHVEAGKADIPIEIKLPSSLDPTFYVRDFGTGLSVEQIYKLYTTYFSSTKTESNAYVGQLGLGSKSPFAYTSNFIVESIYNGTKSIYSCFKNEEDIPSLTALGEMETEEPNGITVQLTVKPQDIYSFNNEARRALMYYDPLPIIIGGTASPLKPYELKHTASGTSWKIRDSEYESKMRGPYVVQGVVAYPIDGALLRDNGLSKAASILTNAAIDFSVDIGVVSVAASRESLHYNTTTIKNLVAIFEEAAAEMRNTIQQQFDDCESAWEVGILVEKFTVGQGNEFGKIFRALNDAHSVISQFTWMGKPVSAVIEIDTIGIKNTTITTYIKSTSKKRLHAASMWTPDHGYHQIYNIPIGQTTFIITDTTNKGNTNLYADYIRTLPELGDNIKLIVIRPTTKQNYDQRELNQIIKTIGNPVVISAEQLKLSTPRPKREYIKRDRAERLLWNGFTIKDGGYRKDYTHRVFSYRCWNRIPINLNAGGFYVPIDGFTICSPVTCGVYVDQLFNYATELGLMEDHINIWGFTKKQIEDLGEDPTWVNLFDYIKTQFDIINKDGQLTGKKIANQVCSDLGPGFWDNIVKRWDNLEPFVKPGLFKTYIEELVKLQHVREKGRFQLFSITNLMRLLGVDDNSDEIINNFRKELQALISDRYQMLQYVSIRNLNSEGASRVIDYVNLVENDLVTQSKL